MKGKENRGDRAFHRGIPLSTELSIELSRDLKWVALQRIRGHGRGDQAVSPMDRRSLAPASQRVGKYRLRSTSQQGLEARVRPAPGVQRPRYGEHDGRKAAGRGARRLTAVQPLRAANGGGWCASSVAGPALTASASAPVPGASAPETPGTSSRSAARRPPAAPCCRSRLPGPGPKACAPRW